MNQRNRKLRLQSLVVAGLLAIGSFSQAREPDVVEFNGSRMVGEVKQLERGKLYFKTDSTDTIAIDWADVTRLVTSRQLRVERRDGTVRVGSLRDAANDGYLALDEDGRLHEEPMDEVVAFDQLKSSFWDQLDVKTSLGYSFTNSNGVEQIDFSASFDYETASRSRALNLMVQQSRADSGESSKRRSAQYQTLRLTSDSPYYSGWLGGYEDNTALQLDYRVLGAWIFGREFYPWPNQRIRPFVGLSVSEESFTAGQSQTSTELPVGTFIDWYRFRSPELDLSSSLIVFPSISDFGRVRASIDISLRWEMISDLFWELSFYNDYDSDPASDIGGGSSTNDYGINTSLGWSW